MNRREALSLLTAGGAAGLLGNALSSNAANAQSFHGTYPGHGANQNHQS